MSSVAKTLSAALLAAGFAGCIATAAEADPIPYQQVGTYNDAIYSFTAAGTGDVTGYIVGGFGAGFTNEVGLLVNGVQTNAGFALNNHASSVGDSFDFGFVHAGDALTFVLENLTLQKDAYSDPTLNIAYRRPGVRGRPQSHLFGRLHGNLAVVRGCSLGHVCRLRGSPSAWGRFQLRRRKLRLHQHDGACPRARLDRPSRSGHARLRRDPAAASLT